MNNVKKLMYRVIVCLIVLGMVVSTQGIITPKAQDGPPEEIDFEDIIFLKRQRLGGAEAQGNHFCDQMFGHDALTAGGGGYGGVFILKNAFSENPTVVNVLENSTVQNGRQAGKKLEGGAFISLDLSYDAKEILFAYTDGHRGDQVWDYNTVYHIYKANIDGSGLTQLTDGVWNDFDPIWLPDGDIMFVSERRGGYGRCHQRPVPTYTLHRMKADGSDIRCLSYHETNEWAPSVDRNGMILYTRWDYVDRGATHMHSAWITTPDGHDARAIALNYPMPSPHIGNPRNIGSVRGVPLMQVHLKQIPNSNKIVGSGVAHHGQFYGSLLIIDPDIEDDDHTATITNITTRLNGNGYPESGGGNTRFATPYPLSEELFLCVYSTGSGNNASNRYRVSLLDISGGQEVITPLSPIDPNISALHPIPVRPRKKPNAIKPANLASPGEFEGWRHSYTAGYSQYTGPNRPDDSEWPDGKVAVQNVYDSLMPFPDDVKITELRIWQIFPKSTSHATNPGPVLSYEAIQSDWAGRSTRGLLGSVPVEEDGSAYFYLPSGKQVFFQAVAEDGTAVQSMKSGTFVIPGQTFLFCQGCHEPRHTVPTNPKDIPLAMQREPSVIKEDLSPGAMPTSFPRLVQPVLDAKCVSCHDGSTPGAPDLRGTEVQVRSGSNNRWFRSYMNLRPYVFLIDDHYNGNWDQVYVRTEPGVFGARASRLYTMLKEGHCEDLTPEELHRLVIWMDSGIAPFYGEYNNTAAQRQGQQVDPILN